MVSKSEPLHWDCAKHGCFNQKKRLKFSAFDGCLPGKISFTDLDGLVEVNGYFLFMEWKAHTEIPTGQRILFERLTAFCPATVLIVEGDAETMEVRTLQQAWRGMFTERKESSLEELRKHITSWAEWAQKQPRPYERN